MWKSSACSKYNATVETTAGFASNSTTNVCLMLAFILKMLELFFSLTLNKFFMNLFWSKIYKYPKINLRQFFCQRWWLQDSNFNGNGLHTILEKSTSPHWRRGGFKLCWLQLFYTKIKTTSYIVEIEISKFKSSSNREIIRSKMEYADGKTCQLHLSILYITFIVQLKIILAIQHL